MLRLKGWQFSRKRISDFEQERVKGITFYVPWNCPDQHYGQFFNSQFMQYRDPSMPGNPCLAQNWRSSSRSCILVWQRYSFKKILTTDLQKWSMLSSDIDSDSWRYFLLQPAAPLYASICKAAVIFTMGSSPYLPVASGWCVNYSSCDFTASKIFRESGCAVWRCCLSVSSP